VVDLESIGDRVLGYLRWILRGDASGAPLEVEVAILCEFDDERLFKMTYFLDRERARTTAEANG
jgi:hypothetical protein